MNKQPISKTLHYTVLILLSLITLLPVLWVVLSSFKPQSELFRVPLTFIPQDWTLENYVSSLAAGNFPVYFSNTVFVAVVSTAITVLINLMAGYALAKYIFKGRDIIFTVMIATLMIPLQVIMIPIFLQLKSLGMLNSLWGIIIPPAATPTGVFLARQYLVTLPNSLIEAARIDGASRWQQFRHITWPLLSPTTFFIFTISTIGSFQVFSQVYMMTPRGGPLKSTMVVVYYLYRKAFEQFEFGYALAAAFVLFMIIFACTLFNKLYLEKKVHYS